NEFNPPPICACTSALTSSIVETISVVCDPGPSSIRDRTALTFAPFFRDTYRRLGLETPNRRLPSLQLKYTLGRELEISAVAAMRKRFGPCDVVIVTRSP